MVEGGGLQAERLVEQELASRRSQQISPAHHFGNAHGGVVHDYGQLIGGHIVVSPDHKIAKLFSSDESLRPLGAVNKGNRFAIGHEESPVDLCSRRTNFDASAGDGIGPWLSANF